MLVLTRRVGETIVIDGQTHITIVAVKRDRVRIGITAPPLVRVDRQEVHVRRRELETQAAQIGAGSKIVHTIPTSARSHLLPACMPQHARATGS